MTMSDYYIKVFSIVALSSLIVLITFLINLSNEWIEYEKEIISFGNVYLSHEDTHSFGIVYSPTILNGHIIHTKHFHYWINDEFKPAVLTNSFECVSDRVITCAPN